MTVLCSVQWDKEIDEVKTKMVKTIVNDLDEVKVQRLPVPYDLKRSQYIQLKGDYVDMIVSSKVELKKCFDIYKEQLGEVLSLRRKLNDSEDRLVEVYERIEKAKR